MQQDTGKNHDMGKSDWAYQGRNSCKSTIAYIRQLSIGLCISVKVKLLLLVENLLTLTANANKLIMLDYVKMK